MNIPEIILVICVVGVSMGVFFGNVSIESLIEINGAIIGFFFIYLLPAMMHAKCLYFTCWKNDEEIVEETSVREKMFEMKDMAVSNVEDL